MHLENIPTGWYVFLMTRVASTRTKLLDAALKLIRQRGYDAMAVDDLCREAGVTKGAFFHHFTSKEALAVAATEYWTRVTGQVFASAPYQLVCDPLDRLLAYIDFRAQLLEGRTLSECTCLLGTLAQEKFDTSPAIRDACFVGIDAHAGTVAGMISAAKERYAPDAAWSPESLALYTQATIQGAFVLAKAKNDVGVAAEMIGHLRRYLVLLFQPREEN
jgi:TetR/AcrR family transcriptional regulator, transcriptional repressor for nem operon